VSKCLRREAEECGGCGVRHPPLTILVHDRNIECLGSSSLKHLLPSEMKQIPHVSHADSAITCGIFCTDESHQPYLYSNNCGVASLEHLFATVMNLNYCIQCGTLESKFHFTNLGAHSPAETLLERLIELVENTDMLGSSRSYIASALNVAETTLETIFELVGSGLSAGQLIRLRALS